MVNAQGVVVGGPGPLSVTFVDQSTATSGIASREWDFNSDGIVDSTDVNPTFVFQNSGRFSVTLRVIGVDGASGTSTIPAFVTVNPLLTVTKSGSGTGPVASNPAGISCGATCGAAFEGEQPVVLTATPDPGSTFAGWLGACTGSAPCSVTMNDTAMVSATFAPISAAPLRIDVDANTSYDALTDGLLIVRYLFGLTGTSLSSGVTLLDPNQLASHMNDIRPIFDVDGNGQADAFTDGVMLIRYLFGLRGSALIAGAIGSGATRTTAEIEAYIQSLMPQ